MTRSNMQQASEHPLVKCITIQEIIGRTYAKAKKEQRYRIPNVANKRTAQDWIHALINFR